MKEVLTGSVLDVFQRDIGRFNEQIASLMPAAEAAVFRQQIIDRQKSEEKARELVRSESAEVIELLAGAIRRPDIARADIERAVIHLNRALSAAALLDPEDV